MDGGPLRLQIEIFNRCETIDTMTEIDMGEGRFIPASRTGAVRASGRRGILIAVTALIPTIASMSLTSGTAEALQPFAADSPWRTAIPADAKVDVNSTAMVARASRDGAVYANLVEFGIPVYYSTPDTPRYTVTCTIVSWGRCPFDGYRVPIPDGARPHSGSDGAMVVIDEPDRRIFEFWQAEHTDGKWTASYGAVNDLYGSGWGGSSTGSGASRLAGVVRIAEIAQGVIPHALAIQSDNVCAGVFRPPALKTDGLSVRPDCIPEGARIRLDPTLNLDSLGLAPAVHAVALALQTYGGYVMDRCSAPLSISFELDPTADDGSIGRGWERAGMRWDYDELPGVPWDRLEVLAEPR